VLLNDSDPVDGVMDSSGLTVGAVGVGSQGGAVSINTNGLWVDYTPAAAFTDTETFTYTARDSGGLTDTGSVSVTVVNGDGGGSIDPGDNGGQTIVIPDTGSSGTMTVTVQIPAGEASDTLGLVYNELPSASGPLPQGYVLAGLVFKLDAYLSQDLQAGYVFSTPITLTLEYSDADVADLPQGEESLQLQYWTGSEWSTDGITVVQRDTDNNRLRVRIAHLSEFALFGGDLKYIYLPIIAKEYTPAPDLVVTDLSAGGGGVTVKVKNQGDVAVTETFWVDVYFNPSETPGLNQPWPTIAEAGAAWGVTKSLAPGESLTLTTGDATYVPGGSSDSFPVGAAVYAYVDSVNYSTSYGNVQESDEGNNLSDPVISTAGQAQGPVGGQGAGPSLESLPER
jgi:hypothetical protein